MSNSDIFQRMEQCFPALPSRRKKACQYIMNNPLTAGNMSLAELAQSCGVGGATVVRLVTEDLGFESFLDFKRTLRDAYVHWQKTNYSDYQKNQMQLLLAEQNDNPRVAATLLDGIPEYLQSLQIPEFWTQLECAVQLLVGAKRIFVVGLRTGSVAAFCFESELNQLTGNVVQLSSSQELIFDHVMTMTPGDVLLVFSNWPCTKRTIDVANFAYRRGIPFILETNTSNHPLAGKAAAVLNSHSVNTPYHIFPTMLMIELLSQEIRPRVRPQTDQLLPEMEKLLSEANISIFEQQLTEEL